MVWLQTNNYYLGYSFKLALSKHAIVYLDVIVFAFQQQVVGSYSHREISGQSRLHVSGKGVKCVVSWIERQATLVECWGVEW